MVHRRGVEIIDFRNITEYDKARLDLNLFGTGAVHIDDNGTVRHIPLKELNKMPELKPGRELDALIAEKVMGLTLKPMPLSQADGSVKEELTFWDGPRLLRLPPYSTRIAAAWEVVEKIKANHALTIHAESLSGGWLLHIDRDIKIGGATAPHVICLAALKAIGSA